MKKVKNVFNTTNTTPRGYGHMERVFTRTELVIAAISP